MITETLKTSKKGKEGTKKKEPLSNKERKNTHKCKCIDDSGKRII
jgi:hypothetical protein